MKPKKRIPHFPTEASERAFWATHDSTEYVDWRHGRRVLFPAIATRAKTISIRLPERMVAALKSLAGKKDVPYQSLMKLFLADRIEQELAPPRSARR